MPDVNVVHICRRYYVLSALGLASQAHAQEEFYRA